MCVTLWLEVLSQSNFPQTLFLYLQIYTASLYVWLTFIYLGYIWNHTFFIQTISPYPSIVIGVSNMRPNYYAHCTFSNTILFLTFGKNKGRNDNPKVFSSSVRNRSPVFPFYLKIRARKIIWSISWYYIYILVWCTTNGHGLRPIFPLIFFSPIFTRFISSLNNRLFLHQLYPFPKLRLSKFVPHTCITSIFRARVNQQLFINIYFLITRVPSQDVLFTLILWYVAKTIYL